MEFPYFQSSEAEESDFPLDWAAIQSPLFISWPHNPVPSVAVGPPTIHLAELGTIGPATATGQGIDTEADLDTRSGGGLRVVSLDSDSDSECLDSDDAESVDLGSHGNVTEESESESELESEEINRIEEVTVSSENFSDDGEDPVARTFEWEFLLAIINARRDLAMHFNPPMNGYDDYIWTPESEPLWQQVGEDVTVKGNPPAAKSVIENLPIVSLSEDELERNGGVCAVCKDEVLVGEMLKELPCLHYYHGECILPWLEIRNSCPVCRFELPTDDLDYERSKSQGSDEDEVFWNWDPAVSLDFELFA